MRVWILRILFFSVGLAVTAYALPVDIYWIAAATVLVLILFFAYGYFFKRKEIDEAEARRHQRALDQYLKRPMSGAEIGRFYERQVGYLLETTGYDVTFHGALKGHDDLGIDIIAHKNKQTLIVQTKCWSKSKFIDEKLIVKIFASTFYYRRNNPDKTNVKPVLYSTTRLSDLAREVAKLLHVEIRDEELDKSYPMIKCNVTRDNERIFHLPTDKYYDHVKIKSENNEFYAKTVAEAMSKGFRRAYKAKKKSA